MSAPRIPYYSLMPDSFNGLLAMSAGLEKSTLGKKLIGLIFLRVSQVNRCAFCNDLHWRELLELGEDVRRLNSLLTWREVPFFTDKERAALDWAEQLTSLHGEHPGDAEFEALGEYFSDQEIAALTFAIACINAWNRLGVALCPPLPPLS